MEIQLRLQNYRCFGDKPATFCIKKGITSFIGANNSGKSTILRFFFEFRMLFHALADRNTLLKSIRGSSGNAMTYGSVKDWKQVFHKGNDRDLVLQISASDPDAGIYGGDITITVKRTDGSVRICLADLDLAQHPGLTNYQDGTFRDTSHGFVYNPDPVRDLFMELTRTIYLGPYRSVGDLSAQGDYFDMQIGRSFVERWNAIKTGDDATSTDKAVAVERSIQSAFKFDQFQINATSDRQSLQVIVNDASYKIQELGSGLAQFIICLAHAAVQNARYILIDEPESNLHAPMQLDFITSLASYAQDGLLFSSHSLGLARSAADTIYVVDRPDAAVSSIKPLESKGTLSQIVGELNFSAYQELGFSVLLLVEGPTEIKALQQFLRKLRIEQHVLMIPLGGSSMINGAREDELRELTRITKDIFALIDSEKTSEKASLSHERTAFTKACKSAKIVCHVTGLRALENYFSDAAVKHAFGATFSALTPYESPRWDKSQNWRVTEAMPWSTIAKTDVGIFLKQIEGAAIA